MKWFLWLSVILLVIHIAESGRIVRTWRRQGRVGSRIRLRPRPFSTWSFFNRRPRILRRNHQPPPFQRFEQMETESPNQRVASIQIPATNSRFPIPKKAGWRPLRGNPIERDPTFAYAPPSNEQVKFAIPRHRRPPLRRKIPGWRGPRPPPHPFWKFLGLKQKQRLPPRFPPRPEPVDEAEVSHYVPNIVYFQPRDVVPSTTLSPTGLRPGVVSDVPIYSKDVSAHSEFIPMPTTSLPTVEKNEDIVMKYANYLGKKGASMLKPVTTPEPKSTTQNSAPTPVEPTESAFFDLIQPPSPISNSFNINIDTAAEGSSDFIKVVESPAKSTTTSTSTTTTTTTETLKPIFALRSTEETVTEESTTTSVSSTSTKSSIYKLPTMQTYKKRPVFQKKVVSTPKTSREQMSSGELNSSIMITGIRSKVKEYKPQILANYSQLLAFDKVSESREESSTLSTTSLSSNSNSSAEVESTSASPMQSFDPLNMIHSWLMKA